MLRTKKKREGDSDFNSCSSPQEAHNQFFGSTTCFDHVITHIIVLLGHHSNDGQIFGVVSIDSTRTYGQAKHSWSYVKKDALGVKH